MQATALRTVQPTRQPHRHPTSRAYNCHMGACQFYSKNPCNFRNHLVEDHKISVYTVAIMDL